MLNIDLRQFAFWMLRSILAVSMSLFFMSWTKVSPSNFNLPNDTSSSYSYFFASKLSDNQIPLVAIFEPANLKIFSNGEPINVVVSAFDFDGSVTKTDLFLNGTLIGTDNSLPYSWTGLPALQNLTVGTYTLRAVATDNLGATSEHVITFFVSGGGVNNQNPTVSFETPSNNQQFPNNSNLYVKANASDSDGSISKIDLFINGVFLRTETTAPYEWGTDVADTPLFSMQSGSYTLKAIATDDKGAIAEASIVITVIGGGTTNTPPTVLFTTPTNQQSFPVGTNLSIAVNASDSNGAVSNVELFFNGNSLGQDPSAPYAWGTGIAALQNLQAGTYNLRAVATDNQGARGEQTISITVVANNNNPPTVQFTTPLNQQTFPAGTDLQVATTATDTDGSIANVELFFNGNTLSQDDTAPYSWGTAFTQLQDLTAGTYTLRAVATDNQGAKGEQTISITVTPNANNNVPPTVNFNFPSNQQNFPVGVNILVVASATDTDGTISGVELYVNGTLLRRDDTTPYQWGDLASDNAIRNLQAGNYTLRAVAYDNLGATGEQTITMTVGSGNANQLPNLTFATPNNNQIFPAGTNLTVETNASDPDGTIAHVTLYLNNSLVRQDIALPFRWESTTDPALSNLQAGTYTLRAVAQDNAGASREQIIQITIQPDNPTGTAPIVSFLTPTNNDTLLQGSNLSVEVSATSNSSTITKVDLFRDSVFIRTEAAAPYEWGKSTTNDSALRNLQPSVYQFKAVATDSKGETGEAIITIIVKATDIPPVVSPITLKFVEPNDQQILPRGTNLYVLLEVQDTISGIKGVELSINDRPLRQKRTAPFDWDGTLRSDTLLRNLQSGTYTLKALAVSNRRDSVQAMISIVINEPPSLNFITPSDQQAFKAGDNILVNIEATDTDGTVTEVALYLNDQLIRRDAALPYEWGINDPLLQNLELGTYTLRAVATDNRGSTAEKEIQIEVISPNNLPEVSFNTPFDGQRLPSGTNLSINTSAIDKDGIIESVTLYLNEQLIREDLAAPYEWGTSSTQDLALRNLMPGIYILKAVAKDNQGGISEATIDIEIYNTPPTIIFDTPLDQESIPSGVDLYVNLGAFDNDGSVANVQLFLNDQLVRQDNTAPYEWGTPTSNDTALKNIQTGDYILRAIATDDDGEFSESIITIRVFQSNQLPIITFDTPLNQQVIEAGTDLYVNVAAIDIDGSITGVALYLNGQFVRTDAVAPYEWGRANQNDILLKDIQPGNYTLRAIATDDDGDDNEASINLQVIRSNFPPTVQFDTPSDQQIFPEGTNLYVNIGAADIDGTVSSVELFLNGQSVRKDLVAPYEWGRNTQDDPLLNNLQAGTYTLRAIATDNKSATAETVISFTVQRTNTEPNVIFISPLNGQSFPEGTTLTVNVNATDSDGSVANVRLFLNEQLVRQDISAPYQWGFNDALLQNLRTGTYTLRAIATDNNGVTGEASVTINVTRVNRAPIVSFSSPAQQQTFPEGTNLTVGVEAIDNDGTIASVTLFLNNQLLGQDITAPYEWGSNFPLLNNLIPGTYILRAVALDNEGATDEETINVVVENVNVPPTVSFASPNNLQQFPAGTTLSVNVNAADADGAIAHVRLFINNQLVRQDANAPYQWGINDVLLQNLPIGTYTLRALATDNEGSTTESSIVIQVVRINQPPTLAFSTPTNSQEITSGTNLNVGVIANDSDGSIANVRLFINQQLIRQITTPPYQWGTNDPLLQNLQPGNYTLRAVATDNEAATSETSISIVVVKVNTPPAVAFITPVNLQQFAVGTNLAVKVDATDSDGTINNIELYFNNQLVRQELAPPYEWGADDIALRNLQVGTYTLRAVATDDKGAKGETSINITVVNGQPNVPPSVSFESPTNNQQFPVGTNLTVTANANDSDGSIAHVRLFLNNQLVRQDNASPYSWGTGDALLQNLQIGTYQLRMSATDNRGLTAETSISITITAQQSNTLPTVTITNPTNNQQFSVGTNLTVTANASDSDGSVAYVRLFLNNQLVRQDNTAPYSWGTGDALLQNLQAGTYAIRTEVTDNLGATAETSINIQVASTSNTSPTVSFAEPTQQVQLPVGTNLYVKIDAADDKAVRRVALYLNNQLVRFETGAPYEWGKSTQNDTALRNLAAGTYTLRAVAEDSEGNTGESTIVVNIGTVSSNVPPSIAFTAPTNQQIFPVGTNLTVNATATDTDGTIAHVRLFLNNTLVRQDNIAPYSWGTGDAALQNLASGTYTLKVVATDDDGATNETTITVQVQTINTSQNPTVSFSQPVNNQSFPTGTNLFVLANASDADGTIRDVVLYLNGVLVRRETGAPYEWGKSTQNDAALRNMAAGTYTLRAVATDNQGNTGEASIQVQITDSGGNTSTFPVVSFINPSNQSSFPVGTNLMVLVSASDTDGGIANVQLYLNGQALRKETLPPYEWGKTAQNDPLLRNLAVGTYTLRAVATDSQSNMSEATIQINVTNTAITANALESRDTKVEDKSTDLELQITPNPFSTNASIRYTLPYTSDVTLSLFDQTGRLLYTLEQSRSKLSGDYSIDFQSSELSSGDYWIRLQTEEQVVVKHLVIIK